MGLVSSEIVTRPMDRLCLLVKVTWLRMILTRIDSVSTCR